MSALTVPNLRRRDASRAMSALLFLLAAAGGLNAAPVSQDQALDAVYAWVGLAHEAMHQPLGRLAGTVTPVLDSLGQLEFYAVDLAPKGYVIVPADDGVEPIVAFSASDVFQAVPGTPLFEMLRADLPDRLARARARGAAATAKWRMLRALAAAPKVLKQASSGGEAEAASGLSDVRVAPLVKSQWDQASVSGQAVYNYYTPPYGSGNPHNYYSGCVATMLAQIMRFHQWPQTGVGTASYQITVNNSPRSRSLRGGDGAGGSYAWASMPLAAQANMPASQQQAIGALVADAGVASGMDYEPSGSGADLKATVLTNAFHYANAAFSQASLPTLDIAIQANLDAGLPVGLGISGNGEGHAVVADGYGYNGSTLYHHLNLGWSGQDDAWYNLPTVVAGGYDFNVVNSAIFNVDPLVKGEIVSGRITDGRGEPVSGAQVTVTNGSVAVTATTSNTGIFAVKGLSSYTTYTVTPSGQSWSFTPASLSVSTGHSSPNGGMGDKAGLAFSSQLLTGSVSVLLDPGAAAAGAQWRVDGGAWLASGAVAPGVPAGSGTVSFRQVKDWTAPPGEPITVTYNQTTVLQASYSPKYSLTAAPDNSSAGQVYADPAPGDQGSYAPNTTVTLTATAAPGYYFNGWIENGAVASTDATYTSVVKGARNLVANFPPVTLTGDNTQVYVTDNKAGANIDVLTDLADTGGSLSILYVTQPSNGAVTINSGGTLTFTPGSKFRGSTEFSYSAGDGTGTITKTVTISNWFAASAGNYAGIAVASDVTNESSGYLKATVTSSGAFSGKLTVAGISYRLGGAFDSNANYQKVIARNGESGLDLALHLDPATDISGTVSDGVTGSDIMADRVSFSAANKTSQAGKYTALLGSNEEVPGNGYMLISIKPAGEATAVGRLADGTPVSTGAYLNADGSLPFYTGIYKSGTGAGSVFGTIDFASGAGSGGYAWFRPASYGWWYPSGFATSGTITGALAPAASRDTGLQGSQETGIAAALSNGGLASEIGGSGELQPDGRVAWTGANAGNLTLTVGTSGQVAGSFIDPATGRKRVILGIWLPGQQLGGGFFLGDDSPGALTLLGQ